MKGEFELIDSIRTMFPAPPSGVTGIGDDCAIIPQISGNDTLVSTDMLVEGTHFLLDDISPYQLGWKAAASNFSDIAAMGGSPVGSFLALGVTKGLAQEWMDGFLEGFREISGIYGFPLFGGDTTASPDRLCICVTVLGKAPSGRSVRRSGASAGDLVCVTGTLGDSAAGLAAILRGLPRTGEVTQLIERHYLPRPRMQEGLKLAASPGVHAMMDISDGIGSDLGHILDESGVGAVIDASRIPLSRELEAFCIGYSLDPYGFAIGGGEDYELLFTVAPEFEVSLEVEHSVIGRIVPGSGTQWEGLTGNYPGFRHF